MKNKHIAAWGAAILAVIFMLSMKSHENGSIKGKINPPDGASAVWAVQGTESVKGELAGGDFVIRELKAGIYTLVIDAVPPFKATTKSGVEVSGGAQTDVGEIALEK